MPPKSPWEKLPETLCLMLPWEPGLMVMYKEFLQLL